jgi:hypothetical protein
MGLYITMNERNIFLVIIMLSAVLPIFVLSTQTTLSQSYPQSINVASGEIAPIGGAITYYAFSVPEEAVDPRLIGQYEVLNGQTIKVDVLDQEGCPTPLSPFECISIYSPPSRDRGNVDVSLTPGKTYYLEFKNDGFLSGGKTSYVEFYVQFD